MSVKAQNIGVEIAGKCLLEDVSFEIEAGEMLAVLGPNGAGKSTLLKTLAGEVSDFEGGIYFGGRETREWTGGEISKCRGVLPQSFAMSFPFKVREVALLGRTPHVDFKESRRDFEIIEKALKTVEISDFAERFYPTLSGGEQQRVQLARVLAQIWEKPTDGLRFLLLDEPTASLDLAHQHLTLQTAREFAAENTVVIAVLHDLNLAAQYADKVLVLKKGRKTAFGKPKNVLSADLIRDVFGIEVYIAEHAENPEIPLIVPTGKAEKKFAGEEKRRQFL